LGVPTERMAALDDAAVHTLPRRGRSEPTHAPDPAEQVATLRRMQRPSARHVAHLLEPRDYSPQGRQTGGWLAVAASVLMMTPESQYGTMGGHGGLQTLAKPLVSVPSFTVHPQGVATPQAVARSVTLICTVWQVSLAYARSPHARKSCWVVFGTCSTISTGAPASGNDFATRWPVPGMMNATELWGVYPSLITMAFRRSWRSCACSFAVASLTFHSPGCQGGPEVISVRVWRSVETVNSAAFGESTTPT